MRTLNWKVKHQLLSNESPVPFGGGSYADEFRDGTGWIDLTPSLQCLSAVGPMRTYNDMTVAQLRTAVVSSAFRRWVLCGQATPAAAPMDEDRVSPVPFGGGSYADGLEAAMVGVAAKGVSSAFRRWVLCGPLYGSEIKRVYDRVSPVPFGGGSYADLPHRP